MRNILTLIICIASFSTIAQVSKSDIKNIQSKLEDNQRLTNANDWNGLMDGVYPKLFDIVPKETMVQMFAQFETMGLKMGMSDLEVGEIQFMEKEASERFFFVPYSAQIQMTFTKEEMRSDEMLGMFKQQFNTQFGEDNVSFEAETFTFDIFQKKHMIAVNNSEGDTWHIMDYDPATAGLIMDKILPEAVLKKLELLTKTF